ncbi:unnamed protein product, partial [marine sediment metagenome]
MTRTKGIKLLFVGCMILLLQKTTLPQTFELKGLVSGWTTVNADSITEPQLGLRYIPEFSIEKSLSQNYS